MTKCKISSHVCLPYVSFLGCLLDHVLQYCLLVGLRVLVAVCECSVNTVHFSRVSVYNGLEEYSFLIYNAV
jgi:hypothetical protein